MGYFCRDLGFSPKFHKYFPHFLFNLEGDKWRVTRNALSPLFTTSKLKSLTPLIDEVADKLIVHLKSTSRESSFDCKNLFQKTSVMIMANVACGIKCNPFENPNDIFYNMVNIHYYKVNHFRPINFRRQG